MTSFDNEQKNQNGLYKNSLISQEFKGFVWEQSQRGPFPIIKSFQIKQIKSQEIRYIVDGSLLRIDFQNDVFEKNEIMKNIEQIQHLQWLKVCGQVETKSGRWIAIWKGFKLSNVGGCYCNFGQKQGLWKELSKNYCNQSQVYEVGEYGNGQRRGFWKYIHEDNIIGGGYYNNYGLKVGKWIELSDNFWKEVQSNQIGEYKYGIKYGLWQINQKMSYQKCLKIMYNSYNISLRVIVDADYLMISCRGQKQVNGFNQIKISINLKKLISLISVIQQGQYLQGIKIGRWDIHYCNNWNYSDKYPSILHKGGGLYDGLKGEKKIGRWIELVDDVYSQSIIYFEGIYNNGIKIGRWNIQDQISLIGGGYYDNEKMGLKCGEWVEPISNYRDDCLVKYTGEYKNGKKVGRWNTYYRYESSMIYEIIGGGSFDDKFGEFKIGQWIEVSDNFNRFNQIVYLGEYKNGKKIGRWDILIRDCSRKIFEYIGGGVYADDHEGLDNAGIKVGQWVELKEEYNKSKKRIILSGQYLNGAKVGTWNIQLKETIYDKKPQSIGRCSYKLSLKQSGLTGIKIGQWVEFSKWDISIIFKGEYHDGIKIGKWNVYQLEQGILFRFSMKKIGGGRHNVGQKCKSDIGSKEGQWIEVEIQFGRHWYEQDILILSSGNYLKGNKVGFWDKRAIKIDKIEQMNYFEAL